ncbi:hypothetical protein D8M21_05490 [Kocuria sp. HSID16901]|nr:hypothetical protein D8M21_05490 [Kocuria sp. HSID16901]
MFDYTTNPVRSYIVRFVHKITSKNTKFQKLALLIIPCSILALSACSTSGDKASDPLSVPPASTAGSETSQASKNQETLKSGQEAVVKDSDDAMVYRFKVNSAEPVTQCPNADYEGAPKPENGNLVNLNIEEEVGDLGQSKDSYIADSKNFGNGVNQSSWTFVGGNGTRANEIMTPITYNCFRQGAQVLPNSLHSNEKAVGGMLLDLPDTKGKLTYTDAYSGTSFTWMVEDLLKQNQ